MLPTRPCGIMRTILFCQLCGNVTTVVLNESLFLTDVSLCDADSRDIEDPLWALAREWRRVGLNRIEIPIDIARSVSQSAIRRPDFPVLLRCPAAPDSSLEALDMRAIGVTFCVDSPANLARRQTGEARPASALKLRRAVESARAHSLEVIVAFPLELDRLRTLLNFGYLVQSFGANRIRLVDGSGRVHPMDLFRSLRALRERLSVPIEIDINDTWGLAVGATVCAIRAGVRHVAVSTNDINFHRKHVPLLSLRGCTAAEPFVERVDVGAVNLEV